MLFNDVPRPGQENIRHAFVRSDRAAVKKGLLALSDLSPQNALPSEAEFSGNYLFSEIAFTDEERHHEYFRCEHSSQHSGYSGLQFPERFQDFRENCAL